MTASTLLGVLLWNIAAGVTVAAVVAAWIALLVRVHTSATDAEAARNEGRLVFDLVGEEFHELDEPLDCEHSTVRITSDWISCANCGETR